jgi:hypothetical protein
MSAPPHYEYLNANGLTFLVAHLEQDLSANPAHGTSHPYMVPSIQVYLDIRRQHDNIFLHTVEQN